MYDFWAQNVAKTSIICNFYEQKRRVCSCLLTSYLSDILPFRRIYSYCVSVVSVISVCFLMCQSLSISYITTYILISCILYIEVSDPHFSTDTLIQLIRFLTVHFSLQGPIGFRIGARTFSNLLPLPGSKYSAPSLLLPSPLAYPNRLPGYAKGMPTLCEGYANTSALKKCHMCQLFSAIGAPIRFVYH